MPSVGQLNKLSEMERHGTAQSDVLPIMITLPRRDSRHRCLECTQECTLDHEMRIEKDQIIWVLNGESASDVICELFKVEEMVIRRKGRA